MSRDLSGEAFERLLAGLDADRSRAGRRYEELRRTLVRYFQWRGVPSPDEQADETFDRVARRLAEGIEMTNLGGYCYEVARLLVLEARKKAGGLPVPLDPILPVTGAPAEGEALEKERRMACLEECLAALPEDQRAFILDYYREDRRGRIVLRRSLAERMGLRREALANRAQRLRDRLERCVNDCLGRKSPT